MPSASAPGLVTAGTENSWWSWFGAKVSAAADLTETREYADLDEGARYRKAVDAQVVWLAHQRRGPAIELRWVSDPVTRTLGLVILGRAWASCQADAERIAVTGRDRLVDLPRHLSVEPILDDQNLSVVLRPFDAHPDGMVAVRKRCLTGMPNRPDAGVSYYFAVQPFRHAARPWTALLQALSAHPFPVMLSVGLEPTEASPGLSAALGTCATAYGRLAREGEHRQGALYRGTLRLAPDAFAVEADKLYSQALQRYRDSLFMIRISLASPAPLDDALASLVGATVSPPETGEDRSYLNQVVVGSTFSIERPRGLQATDAFAYDLATLSHSRWGGDPVWDRPDPPPPVLRELVDLVDPAEASCAFRLPIAASGSLPGFPVRRPGLAGATTYESAGPDITLGRQLIDDRPSGAVGIPLGALTTHTLIVGTTGSGKTNTTLAFLSQLWADHHVPFLVIEPVNSEQDDYRWLMTRPAFEEMVVFTVGDESVAPFRLNPFEVPHGVTIGTHVASLLACFDAAFGLWDPLPIIYNRALRDAYTRRGIVLSERSGPAHAGRWPGLGDFVEALGEQTDRLDYAGEVRSNITAAARLRAESLMEGACASVLDCTRSYPMADLLSRPVVVELAGVGDNAKEQALVTALLLMTMTEYYKAGRESSDLRHVTVIEEAHRLLGKPAPTGGGPAKEGDARSRAAEAFANTLAENRKYGEAVVIVEQDPTKLVSDAYKNTNLKIMHRLPAAEDRCLVGATMRFSPDQERYASSLEPFTAFAFHSGLDRPALVRVPNIRAESAAEAGLSSAPLADNGEVTERFRQLCIEQPAFTEALAPYDECGPCRHQCLFRARASVAAARRAPELRELIGRYPPEGDDAGWWGEAILLVKDIGAPLARDIPTDPSGRGDFDACVFLHLLRAAYSSPQPTWAGHFWRAVRSRPGGTGSLTAHLKVPK